jgi:hypothetical protein
MPAIQVDAGVEPENVSVPVPLSHPKRYAVSPIAIGTIIDPEHSMRLTPVPFASKEIYLYNAPFLYIPI